MEGRRIIETIQCMSAAQRASWTQPVPHLLLFKVQDGTVLASSMVSGKETLMVSACGWWCSSNG